jgi:hypothetical protein
VGIALLSALILGGLDRLGVTTPRFTQRWDEAVGGAAIIVLLLIWLTESPREP